MNVLGGESDESPPTSVVYVTLDLPSFASTRNYFDMKITNEQRAEVIARATRIQDATISVAQGE